MDGVYRGNQLWDHVDDSSSKAHFKKWYKRGHLDLCYFGLLNSHIAWNISCDRMVVCGVPIWESLKKWHFCAILAEYLMNFTAIFDSDNTT